MQSWTWIKTHGDKALAGLLTLLTAANGYDPTLITAFFGDQGSRWVAFCLAVALLAHTTLVNPSGVGNGNTPTVPKQGGSIRVAQLVMLAGVAALLLAIGAAARGPACHPPQKVLPELITPPPSGDQDSPGMVARP